jgi:hypothetical protein
MTRIHIALAACALSACTLAEDEATPSSTTDVDRRVRPFETEMFLRNGDCGVLTVISHWTVAQPDQVAVVYTIRDLTSRGSYTASYFVEDSFDIGDSEDIVLLSPLLKGKHRFLLEAALLDSNGNALLEDTYRTRFPCQR